VTQEITLWRKRRQKQNQRTTPYIYVARTRNNRVIMACELYCCLLPRRDGAKNSIKWRHLVHPRRTSKWLRNRPNVCLWTPFGKQMSFFVTVFIVFHTTYITRKRNNKPRAFTWYKKLILKLKHCKKCKSLNEQHQWRYDILYFLKV